MVKSITNKLIDSNEKVSDGGRAQGWWSGKPIKRMSKYESDDNYRGRIDQFEIIKKFSLKGFEYGNWVNNDNRHDFLRATAESCTDLSRIFDTKNIGLDGNVGIAFGARGHSAALAHFEPSTFMINLTKENGFGSLAHEYGHALDYFFGMYVDQSREYSALSGGSTTRMHIDPQGGDLRRKVVMLVNDIIKDGNGRSETYRRWENSFKGEYWFRRCEIFARFFEQWVRYRMQKKGIKNTFLSKKKYETASYVLPKDFERVAPQMDVIAKEMAAFMNNKKKSVRSTVKSTVRK